MIRLIILAIVLSTLSGSLGAGLAACRNWTMGPPAATDTTAAASPEPGRHARYPAERDRPAVGRAGTRAARPGRAAEQRLERMAQPQATHTRPEPAQPAAPPAPPATARAADATSRQQPRDPRQRPEPSPAPQATPITIPAGTAIAVRTANHDHQRDGARRGPHLGNHDSPTSPSDGHTAIPVGSRLLGSVTAVERAGRMSGSDRITIRFHTLAYNGLETPLETAPVTRNGPGQASQNATRIGGGAAVGAILGSILGGRKGAAIGGAIGAGGGGAAAAAQHAAPAVLEAREALTLRTTRPAEIETR